MFKRINESFDKKYQPLEESTENIVDELRRALYNKCSDLQIANNYNLKSYEIGFQDVIEGFFPENSWWEVCDLDIFTDLFSYRNPFDTVEKICDSIKTEFRSDNTEDSLTSECMDALKEVLSRMNEEEMSDEDRHDSDLIRSMIQKMQARSNAAFTPEEKAVMAKYGIERNNWRKKLTVDERELNPNIDDASYISYFDELSYSNGTPSKINYADRARKLPARKQNQIAGDGSSAFYQNAHYNAHRIGTGIQDSERAITNDRMREPIDTMQRALKDRRYAQSQLDNADAERARRMTAAQDAYDRAKKMADWHYERDTVGGAESRDRAQGTIDRLLKKGKKEESLVESPIYDMSPQYDARKSFYGKARVDDSNGELTLYSYNTPVAKIVNGKVTLLPRWDESQTTLRHVKEFLRQNGFEASSLAQIRKTYL